MIGAVSHFCTSWRNTYDSCHNCCFLPITTIKQPQPRMNASLLSLLFIGLAACSSPPTDLDKTFMDKLDKEHLGDLYGAFSETASTELIPYYQDLRPTDKAHARVLKSLSNHLVGSNRNHDVVISKLSKALAE